MTEKRGRHPHGWYIFSILLILVAALVIFTLSRWELRVTLHGDAEATVEYGETWHDPGAEAHFGGEHIPKAFPAPAVTSRGAVNTLALGKYQVQYSASFLWFSATAARTVRVVDTTPPEITLYTVPGSYTLPGGAYEEEGYVAMDNVDGDLTGRVERREDSGVITYRVADNSGNVGQAQRRIAYEDPIPPVITLLGEEHITLAYGEAYAEPGYTAADNIDGDLTAFVSVSGAVFPNVAGDYELHYTVEDASHNQTEVVRTVTVSPKPAGIVYLTFDDGPSKYTQDLLDILDKYDVKVTFFVVNYGYNSVIGKEAAAGHTVGVHSATHDYYEIYASEEAYFDDLQKMNDIIYKQTGAYTDLIRFPGGSSNTISDFNPGIMTRMAQAVVARGYQYFDWNVSSEDAGGTTDPDQVYQNVIDGISHHDTSVVLMHDSKSHTVEAVERIVLWCLDNGYELRPLTKDSYAAHHSISN